MSFANDFAAAFDALDRRGDNQVRLSALRAALELDRAEFDAGLRALRLSGLWTLDSSDGRHVRLSDEDRAAGIVEGSSLLVYAARRAQ